jgi:hypothetical protein
MNNTSYGFGRKFAKVIKSLYAEAESSLQVNGHGSRAFPIKSSVRQGWTLSMMLFAIALNPLIVMLEATLTGVTLGPSFFKFTSVAYADNVTVIVSRRTDINHLHEALNLYERATGTKLNYRKSQALPIGAWDTKDMILSIPYVTEAKILGISFQSTLAGTMNRTWTKLANSVKGRAQEMYARDSNLLQRVHVTHAYLLSKIWYCAQILPISQGHTRQITMCMQWFVWHGDMFRIPTSISHCSKQEGGLGMLHVCAKCLTLLLSRLHHQCRKRETVTEA